MNPTKRTTLMAGLAVTLLGATRSFAARTSIEVWKSPACDCCSGWVQHLQASGFTVKVNDTGNTAARKRLNVPERLGSCHTAEVAGFAIEGHVPAGEIKRLLAERPRAIGLAVAGMPVGSPGMEDGNRREAYDVLLIERGGKTRVYKSYPGTAL